MSDIADVMGSAFNPQEHDTTQEFEALPPGEYPVLIDAAEVKLTKAKTGSFLKLETSVIEGEYKGRKIFHNITLKNPNAKAEEIGVRELATLGQAVAMLAITDSSELVNKAVIVKLKVKDDPQYGKQNEVVTFKPYGQPVQQQQQTTPAQQQVSQPVNQTQAPQGQSPASGGQAMPWQK